MSYADLALGASNVLLNGAVGAGVNQSLFTTPGWFSSPPESLPDIDNARSLGKFWAPLQAGSALALGTAWALNREGPRGGAPLSLARRPFLDGLSTTGGSLATRAVR